jgi:exopolysaccharide biosynthesis polyprenyl glycosylphosphotransferase
LHSTSPFASSAPELDRVPTLGLHTGNHKWLKQALVFGDGVAIALAWTLAFLTPGAWLATRAMEMNFGAIGAGAGLLVIIVGLSLLFIASERLYLSRVCNMRTVELARIARVAIVSAVAALIVSRLIGEPHLARIPVLVGAGTFVILNVWRMGFSSWLTSARKKGRYLRSVLLVGANTEAQSLYSHINSHPELGYRFYGYVGNRSQAASQHFDIAWLGEVGDIARVCDETGIKGAFVVSGSFSTSELNDALRRLLDREVHVNLSTGVNGIDHRRMQSHSVAYEPLVYVERANLETWQLACKRVLDAAMASLLLVLSSPLLVATAIAIKAHDGGPILFRQERVGRYGIPFNILKFRSMSSDAEERIGELRAANVRSGPLFKMSADPRVTKLGKVLRATSIDELPQLWNVVRGNMSLVGPRPALPSEVAQFEERLLARQNVLPGITGLWQIEGRDNPDFGLYKRLDLFYVENWSVILDFAILLATAKVVVARSFAAFQRKTKPLAKGSGTASSVFENKVMS